MKTGVSPNGHEPSMPSTTSYVVRPMRTAPISAMKSS